MYPSCVLPWLVCICFLWELWSGSPGSHMPVMRSLFIPLPWSASTSTSARLPGGRLWAGAVLPGEAAPAMPLRQPSSEPFPWPPAQALPSSCSCDTCPCGIPLSGALGGSAVWLQLAAASTLPRF